MGAIRYEASTLLQAARERVKAYEQLEQQILHLQQTFNGVANLGEDLKGKGADNIKQFYKGHASIVDQWLNLIRTQLAFFKSIPLYMESENLAGQTLVYEGFLEGEVATGIQKSREMVNQQQSSLNDILSSIQDIVSLNVFSDEVFEESMERAEKDRKDTVEAVRTLDETLLSEYSRLDVYYQSVAANQQALMSATNNGGNASPLYFDERAFQSSRAYQLQEKATEMAFSYLRQKERERKALEERIEVARTYDFTEVYENLNATASSKVDEALDGLKEFGRGSMDSILSASEKSANSFKEIGSDVWEGMENRADKWNDSWYDFGNYMTMGAFDGAVGFRDGLKDRSDQALNSTYDFFNYASVGLLDIANEAINPKDPLSKEHWSSSIALFTTFLGGVKPVSATKSKIDIESTRAPKQQPVVQQPKRPTAPALSLVERWKRMLSMPVLHNNEFAFAGIGSHDMIPDVKPETPKQSNVMNFSTVDNYGGSRRIDSSKTIRTVNDAHEWGEKHYREWLNWLTDQEREGIIDYTGNDYAPINRYLREISDTLEEGVDSRTISAIYNGLSKAEVPHDMTVYRGTGIGGIRKYLEFDEYREVINIENFVGRIVEEKGFMSTAILKDSSFNNQVSWTINVPEGADGAYVGSVSKFPDEAELLFNMNQKMIIREASVDDYGNINLVADLIKKKEME
ncbi:T7SS effector LXG polymorphic toxin [Metabacillus iocasae]|uniref:LXG domain-containing protein n=1 Tax=Priestia iocasae TaxID=2291674 RepID=A0ABS2QRL5_9BACI|nr:T7SS effector LXG polymorphic toxin [Metabacillus iocasae]MBM7702105.1 hypothetical protein [Metabacillus iocasae]